jgi:hypothetical protein
MHGPIKVKSPNNIRKWQMGFNSAFKVLKNARINQYLVLYADFVMYGVPYTRVKYEIDLPSGHVLGRGHEHESAFRFSENSDFTIMECKPTKCTRFKLMF